MFLVSTRREWAVRTDAKSRCTCRGRRSNCLSANYMGGRSNEEEHRSGPSRVDSDGSATRYSTQYGMMTEMRSIGELLSSRIPSTRHEQNINCMAIGSTRKELLRMFPEALLWTERPQTPHKLERVFKLNWNQLYNLAEAARLHPAKCFAHVPRVRQPDATRRHARPETPESDSGRQQMSRCRCILFKK